VVQHSNSNLRRYQYFNVPDWSGGLYASPTAAGSRSGGLTAATWAPELILIGDPTFVISFRSDDVDIYHVNDFMKTRGWRYNYLQLPPALHFFVTMPQTAVPGIADRMVTDLKEAVVYARSKAGTLAETTALYGLAGSLEDNQKVTEMIYGALD